MFHYSGAEEEELEKCTQHFLAKLLESTVTPSEIQGFLLNGNEYLSKAVEDANDWIAQHFARDPLVTGEKASKRVVDTAKGTEIPGNTVKGASDLTGAGARGLVFSYVFEVIRIVVGDDDSENTTS